MISFPVLNHFQVMVLPDSHSDLTSRPITHCFVISGAVSASHTASGLYFTVTSFLGASIQVQIMDKTLIN